MLANPTKRHDSPGKLLTKAPPYNHCRLVASSTALFRSSSVGGNAAKLPMFSTACTGTRLRAPKALDFERTFPYRTVLLAFHPERSGVRPVADCRNQFRALEMESSAGVRC